MSSFKDAYLTNNGADLIAEAIAEGVKIEFVKMVVGDGEYEDEEKSKDALQQRTGLKSLRQECGFSSVEATDQNAVKLKAIIGNKNVTEGYRIREIGIIAKKSGDTTTEGILYSIAVAEEADYLPSEDTPISYIQEYYTKVNNAENVMINVSMGAYAAAEDVERLSKPTYEEPENLEELTSGEELETAFGKIKKAVSTLIDHIVKKASLSVLGHVKLSDSSAVTNSEGIALPATEKNASIKGTLANQIAAQNDALELLNTNLNKKYIQYGVANCTYLNNYFLRAVVKLSKSYSGSFIGLATKCTNTSEAKRQVSCLVNGNDNTITIFVEDKDGGFSKTDTVKAYWMTVGVL